MEDLLADGFAKALSPDRHRKLPKMMGMGMWQKSEDYTITESNKKMEEKKNRDWKLQKSEFYSCEITRLRRSSFERASYPVLSRQFPSIISCLHY